MQNFKQHLDKSCIFLNLTDGYLYPSLECGLPGRILCKHAPYMQGNSSVTDRKLRVGYSMIFSPYDEQKSLGLNFSSLTAHSWIPSQVLHSDDLASERLLMEKNVRLNAKKNLTQSEIENLTFLAYIKA